MLRHRKPIARRPGGYLSARGGYRWDSLAVSRDTGPLSGSFDSNSTTLVLGRAKSWGNEALYGQETKHVNIGHVKIFNWLSTLSCTFPWALENFPWALSWESSWGPSSAFCTDKASTFVGISVDIFVYTPVCIFVSTIVREFVGQISRFACSVLVWL